MVLLLLGILRKCWKFVGQTRGLNHPQSSRGHRRPSGQAIAFVWRGSTKSGTYDALRCHRNLCPALLK